MKTIDTEQVIYSKRLFKFNRRYCFAAFLSFAVILVILILPILPPPVSVFRERQEIVVEKSCGEENINGKNILVAYETKYGSTATVAEKIGDVLCEEGFQVDIKLARNVNSGDISGYDCVIVGSAIIFYRWLPGARKFLRKNESVLSDKQVAYFIVCGTMNKGTEEARKKAYNNYIVPILNNYSEIEPVAEVGMFTGAFNWDKLYTIDYLLMKIFEGSKENGDWRDMDKVSSWAEDVGAIME